MVGLVRMLIMRKLMIIIAVVIVFLLGLATAIAYYASTGESHDPVKKVTVPGA
jgi:hypothetical protein